MSSHRRHRGLVVGHHEEMARRWWVDAGMAWTVDSTGIGWSGALLGCPVLEVVSLPGSDDCVAVLDWTEPAAGAEAWHPFANLVRARPDGEVMWAAAPPPNDLKCWTSVGVEDGEVVARGWSHRCVIDPGSGQILRSEFTK